MDEVLTLWIFTHALAEIFQELPKPVSCQKCMSGWICIGLALVRLLVGDGEAIEPFTWWAASVFLEAVYQRLCTMII